MIYVTYQFFCDVCGALDVERPFQHFPNAVLPTPGTPPGWQTLAGKTYCPYHDVKIVVDGKPSAT